MAALQVRERAAGRAGRSTLFWQLAALCSKECVVVQQAHPAERHSFNHSSRVMHVSCRMMSGTAKNCKCRVGMHLGMQLKIFSAVYWCVRLNAVLCCAALPALEQELLDAAGVQVIVPVICSWIAVS